MRSISILGVLFLAAIANPAAAHGPSDEISLCTTQVESAHACCGNPATCMTEDQGKQQAELDAKTEQSEKLRAPAGELTALQKKVNSAARDNCINAVKACIEICDGVDEESSEACRHDKQNIEIFKKQSE